eukprot:6927318-Prymnesium_polylepis.2
MRLDSLRMLRLHSSYFSYEVGGHSFSVIEMEHAVLRAARPRPAFIGTYLVIPKFRRTDPRFNLCPTTSHTRLLIFGLVPGTSFSPPLCVYNAKGLAEDLAENARRFLQHAVTVRASRGEASDGSSNIVATLPIQLLWHQQDLGRTPIDALRALMPLLPTEQAELLGAAPVTRVSMGYASYEWRLLFRV